MTYLVTGATGNAGRQVVAHLLRRGQRVRALSRKPDRAGLPAEVEVVSGDLTAPDTLGAAFDGVTGVHLLTVGGDDYATLRTGPEIAELAVRAAVRHVTILWNGEVGPVERAVADAGLAWTRLQPVDFMSNALAWADSIRAEGLVEAPFGSVPNAVIHEDDLGAVAAATLVEEGHAGQTYHLTGPEALTPRQRLATIGTALGRELEFAELTEAQARERWLAEGIAEELVDVLATWAGNPPPAAYTVSPAVERILGRPARTFAGWAAEHADAFR
ncbi:NAD(P)H-binding protein [Amycolatopsis anabasis]|uniref:NmrA family NAD(P)-binding protein n=1 Tax=Amycolatopsis anabasis TaxID=1840409 RepID=UPI00131E5832|nr:NAD(P)H-binding protein [Amycolatopsis anabasis]